jgi:hypothetical protein
MYKNYLLLFVFILLGGCSQIPTKDIIIDTAADPEADFSSYHSYAWLGAAMFFNDPEGQWEPPGFDADAEIRFLIDRELRDRGMTESSVAPDIIVTFVAGVDMDALALKTNPETKLNTLENIPQGGLIIILTESSTGYTVWLGTAVAEVQQYDDTGIMKARLDYAVTQMLKTIPR